MRARDRSSVSEGGAKASGGSGHVRAVCACAVATATAWLTRECRLGWSRRDRLLTVDIDLKLGLRTPTTITGATGRLTLELMAAHRLRNGAGA